MYVHNLPYSARVPYSDVPDLLFPDIKLDECQPEERKVPTVTLNGEGKPHLSERTVKQRVGYLRLIPHGACEGDYHRFEFVNGGFR